MTSFLGWNSASGASGATGATGATAELDKNISSQENTHLLNIAVEASGIDCQPEQSPVESGGMIDVIDKSDDNACKKANSGSDGDGSDYVLDSDHSDSPRSPLSDHHSPPSRRSVPTSEQIVRRIRTDKTLTKVSSTGNLRVYHKTDLKNKITAVEHRLLMLEKRILSVEKKCEVVVGKSDDDDEGFSVPTMIKIVGGCLLFLHFGRWL